MLSKKLLRIFLPIVLIIIWLGVGSVGGPIFSKVTEVTTNDRASFLPAGAESTQVQELQTKYQNGKSIPAIIVLESSESLSPDYVNSSKQLADKVQTVSGVDGPVIGPIPSKDLKAIQFIVPISTASEPKVVVEELRSSVNENLPNGVTAYVTGPAGLSADIGEAFGGIDGILLLVALTSVFIILLIVYRSALLPILVLINAIFALSAAIGVVYLLAKNGIIELNGQSQGILFILVIGAATDYSLLLVARYKEALERVENKWDAIKLGVKGSFEPILASAVTVILALLCLLFSDLNSNKSLGPIAATGIVFAFLATLTFLPSVLVVFGKSVFWPSKVKRVATKKSSKIITGLEDLSGTWQRIGRVISNHARAVWVTVIIVLAIGSLGLLQLKASGVPQTDLLLSRSNAADGQKAIARHYSAGSGAPVLVAVPSQSANAAFDVLKQNQSFAEITAYSERGQTPDIDKAKVIDGKKLLSATLTVDPYSEQAENTVRNLRTELSTKVPGSQVGGISALDLDTTKTASSDFKKIVPLVLLMIFIVLIFLLRSLLAPLVLILTVVISFAATLGISALVFNHIFHFPGADAAVPLFGFVFLVALGVDYNIFLVSRTREEALKYGTRAAILHSLGKTGGVITSAGIVLAATFAALGIIPILFLVQLAFIVALGVLIDTIIVRSLLVTSLFKDIGPKVWWPSKLTKK